MDIDQTKNIKYYLDGNCIKIESSSLRVVRGFTKFCGERQVSEGVAAKKTIEYIINFTLISYELAMLVCMRMKCTYEQKCLCA